MGRRLWARWLPVVGLLAAGCGDPQDGGDAAGGDAAPPGIHATPGTPTPGDLRPLAAAPVYRVNAGGPAVSGTPPWAGDTAGAPSPYVNAGATGNQVYATTASISLSDPSVPAGTPMSLFQTERWDPAGGSEMAWAFPVTPGQYEVRLYFAEIYSGAAAVGARLFNVSIEGASKLNNFDVYAAAGGLNRGIMRSFTVTSDATLNIGFGHVKENPAVQAIEIIPATAGGGGSAAVGFGKSLLAGAAPASPTSLQFGPDGKLYVAQVNGLIKSYTISRAAANNYQVTQAQTISLINTIANHDDGGAPNASLTTRQITGLLATGSAANPVLYVTSSDPRIGGGSAGTDTGLDTNSGVLSKLTWNGSAWSKLDLVRGLPRSEENHSPNGMALDAATQTLYMGVGGNTNMGAPSNNFAYLPEYALSAAVLQISLGAIGNATYDLPTLDDENRAGSADAGDPFGGNDGKNQAKLVPGGPVGVYAAGFRNPYDVVRTAAGKLYAIDNGPNAGWGDVPIGEGPAGTCTNGVHEPGVTYGDGLHYLAGAGYYGGHPNPTRANPANTFNASNPQSPVSVAHPVECDFRATGTNGSLYTFPSSTDGIAEYTASNFGGAMKGNLLAAGYVYNTLYRLQLTSDGAGLVQAASLFSNVGQSPLDVWAQGDAGPFPGTIWVADMGAGKVVVFEPNDYGGAGGTACSGTYSATLDEDGDGYKNADEIDNGTNPCSAADVPPDWDKDFVSNLNDPDDDNDGASDTTDKFAIDPQNGLAKKLPVSYTWNSDAPAPGGLLNLGFTGLMTNGAANYQSLYDPAKMTAGGAAGVLTVDQVPAGDAWATYNSQQYGFQFGVDARPASTGPFVVHTRLVAPFSGAAPKLNQSQGLFLGTGDQDNYLKLVAGSFSGGTGIQVLKEVAASPAESPVSALALPGPASVDLYLRVDPATGVVTPKYQSAGGALVTLPSVAVPTSWFAAGLAIGLLATADGSGATFAATWDLIEAVPESGGAAGSVLAKDTFTRTLAGSWGSADTGGAWSIVAGGASNFSVDGSRGVLALAAFGTEKVAVLGAVQALSVDAKADFVPSGYPASGAGLFGYLLLRRQSGGGYYRLGAYLTAAGNLYLRGQTADGALLFSDVNTGLVLPLGAAFSVRAEAQGANPTTLRLKAWATAQAEPGGWQVQTTSAAAGLQGAGAVGVRAVNTGAGALTLRADNIVATALGGAAAAATGHWETRAPTGLSRQEVSYAQLNGNLYLTGGGTAQQVYAPATNAWRSAAPLPAALDHIQSVAVGGKLYYPGGLFAWPGPAADTLYIYDPVTNAFSAGSRMPAGRGRGAGGVAVYSGKLYYAGGLAGGVAVNYFDEYDPAVNAWRTLAAMPRVRDHFHAAVVNGALYAIGGRNTSIDATLNANDAYAFATGVWQTGLPPLPTPRGGFAAAVLGAEILILGGEGGGRTYANVEAFDTVARTWRTLAPMPTARHGIEAAVCNGGVYVADGGTLQGDGGATQVHEVFFLGTATACP